MKNKKNTAALANSTHCSWRPVYRPHSGCCISSRGRGRSPAERHSEAGSDTNDSRGSASCPAGAVAAKGTPHDCHEHANRPRSSASVRSDRRDANRTAAVTSLGVFGSVALSLRNLPVATRLAPGYHAIVDCSASANCACRNYCFSNIINAATRKNTGERLSFVNSSTT